MFTAVSKSTHSPINMAPANKVLLGLSSAFIHSESSSDIESATCPFGITVVGTILLKNDLGGGTSQRRPR